MRTLRDDGWKKVIETKTTIEEVLRVTQTEEHLKSLMEDSKSPSWPKAFLMARWHIVNVLHTSASGRRLWQLSPTGDQFAVQGEKTLLLNEGVPPGMAAKDWQSLFRHKLNIAWLPADRVFLRAIQLPVSDSAEIGQMIELQLEKLSPLPVAQMVWSFYLLPRPLDKPDSLQTVIVIIAARAGVEEFLGQLEQEGIWQIAWKRRDWIRFWPPISRRKASGFSREANASRC